VRTSDLTTDRIFVDSSAYAASVLKSDGNHLAARSILIALSSARRQLLTTNLIAAETHALVLGRSGRLLARQTLAGIDRSFVFVRVSEADEVAGRAILDRHADKDCSLTDAISFAVMDRLGLRAAFAFDRHFAQYGIDVLTPE